MNEQILQCSAGYHLAGRKCVLDGKCQPDTCSKHGLCDDSEGFPKCTCFPGFITVGDHFCSACDTPSHKFPDCYEAGERRDEMTMKYRCTAAVVPHTLNAPGLLTIPLSSAPPPPAHSPSAALSAAYGSRSIHLSEWYHLNIDLGIHITTFTLNVPSVFRVYVLSDHSVKVGLYPGHPGAALLAAGSNHLPKEGGIYRVLEPGPYALTFVYDQDAFFSSPNRVPCPTMHMELAIRPLDTLDRMPFTVAYQPPTATVAGSTFGNPAVVCGHVDKRPEFINQHRKAPKKSSAAADDSAQRAPHEHDSDTHQVVVNTEEQYEAIPYSGYTFKAANAAGTGLAIHAAPPAGSSERASGSKDGPDGAMKMTPKGRLGFDFSFSIPEYLHHQAFIIATTQFDFLLGQLRMELIHHMPGGQSSMLWQHKENAFASQTLSWLSSKFGDVYSNENQIRVPLPPGNYTLTLYEPLAQNASLTKCSPYDFEMTIGYVRLPHVYQRKRAEQWRKIAQITDPPGSPQRPGSTGASDGMDPTLALRMGLDEQYSGELDSMDTDFDIEQALRDGELSQSEKGPTVAPPPGSPGVGPPAPAGGAAHDSAHQLHHDELSAAISVDNGQDHGSQGKRADSKPSAEEAKGAQFRAAVADVFMTDEEFTDVQDDGVVATTAPSVSPDAPPPPGSLLVTRDAAHATALSNTHDHLSRAVPVPIAELFLEEECALRPLPASLNVPGLLGSNGHVLHVHDKFRYDATGHTYDVRVNLSVPTATTHVFNRAFEFHDSLIKVYIPYGQTRLHIQLSLLREDGDRTETLLRSIDNTDQDILSAVVSGGIYILRFAFDVHFNSYHTERDPLDSVNELACLGFVMEIAIAPTPRVADYKLTHHFNPKSVGNGTSSATDNPLQTFLPTLEDCPNLPYFYRNPALPLPPNLHSGIKLDIPSPSRGKCCFHLLWG